MLRLNNRQRSVLVDKLPDTANVGLAGLLFGRALTGESVQPGFAVGGLVLWMVLIASSLILARKGRS